jgi:hypothetical protein
MNNDFFSAYNSELARIQNQYSQEMGKLRDGLNTYQSQQISNIPPNTAFPHPFQQQPQFFPQQPPAQQTQQAQQMPNPPAQPVSVPQNEPPQQQQQGSTISVQVLGVLGEIKVLMETNNKAISEMKAVFEKMFAVEKPTQKPKKDEISKE